MSEKQNFLERATYATSVTVPHETNEYARREKSYKKKASIIRPTTKNALGEVVAAISRASSCVNGDGVVSATGAVVPTASSSAPAADGAGVSPFEGEGVASTPPPPRSFSGAVVAAAVGDGVVEFPDPTSAELSRTEPAPTIARGLGVFASGKP